MAQQPSPQRQLFNVRQIVAALGVLACVAFVVSYSSRILVGMRTQQELEATAQGVAALELRQQELDVLLEKIDDSDAVEEFARDQLNWTRAGDQVVAPIEKAAPVVEPSPAAPETVAPSEPQSNLRAWWQLLAPGAPAP